MTTIEQSLVDALLHAYRTQEEKEGRVDLKPGDPFYDAPRPSEECVAKLEQMERDRAAGAAGLRYFVIGSTTPVTDDLATKAKDILATAYRAVTGGPVPPDVVGVKYEVAFCAVIAALQSVGVQ